MVESSAAYIDIMQQQTRAGPFSTLLFLLLMASTIGYDCQHLLLLLPAPAVVQARLDLLSTLLPDTISSMYYLSVRKSGRYAEVKQLYSLVRRACRMIGSAGE